jgi:uncharacterized protein YbjT (DUF2867 family)
MRVLVTGGYGFIGARIVAALIEAGHRPVAAVRGARVGERFDGIEAIACDFARDVRPEDWLPRLAGIDAVVNCAGILRERGADTHARVHETVPSALFEACARSGVRRVVQISALGDPAAGEFIASKQRGDAALMRLDLDWVVLRPSVVVSTAGSYGGTSLLRALAALPLIPLPGDGSQRLQPVAIEDLCRAVLAALERPEPVRQCLQLGGPAALSLRDYLAAWRQWLGFGRPRFVPVPSTLARIGAATADRLGRGPMGLTMWRMLERGNVLGAGEYARSAEALGVTPRSLQQVLRLAPAHSADRWQARLHFLAPALRAVLALTWIASGLVGFSLQPEAVLALMRPSGLPDTAILALAWGGSAADIGLGLLLLLGRWTRPVLVLMALMVFGYTALIGILLPTAWLDPFGGLLKNPLVLLAIAAAWITAERD